VVIAASEIDDKDIVASLLGKIARKIPGREHAERVRSDRSWHE